MISPPFQNNPSAAEAVVGFYGNKLQVFARVAHQARLKHAAAAAAASPSLWGRLWRRSLPRRRRGAGTPSLSSPLPQRLPLVPKLNFDTLKTTNQTGASTSALEAKNEEFSHIERNRKGIEKSRPEFSTQIAFFCSSS